MFFFFRDLQYGLRQLRRRPAFSAAAIGSLALGIGLNTTLFSVVNAVLLRDSLVARPDRLVEIYTGANKDYPQLTTSYPDYLDIQDGAEALSGVAANAYVRGILSSGSRSVLVTGEAVSANYFELLGITPVLGRGFREDEDDVAGSSPLVVVSHAVWQSRLAARAGAVGETIRLSGFAYTIVGVAPPGFTGTVPGVPTDFWVPVTMVDRLEFAGVQWSADEDKGATRLERRGTRWLFLKGRLADGRTVEEARAQVEAIFARLRKEYPGTNDTVTASVIRAADIRFHPMLDGYLENASAALLVGVALVLLIACANVANMLLARGTSRRREFAIRAAIGASRARLVSQLLSEGLLLAAAGGLVGVLIAGWAGRTLSGFGTNVFPMPIKFDFSIDRTVLVFALIASIATAFLFGLAPAWSSSKPDLVPGLKDPAERRRRLVTLSDVLVVGQLALSLVLLVAGSLLARGLLAARGTDLGYDPTPVSSLSFNLQMNAYDRDRATALLQRAVQAIRALPGVSAVSTASRLPLAPDINMDGVLVPGHHRVDDKEGTLTDTVSVGADYFTVVGIPIVAGRAFTEDDVTHGRRVAIVNETMARHYWPDGAAVGRRLHTGGFASPPFEIVGVARDHKVRSFGEAPRSYMHVPAPPSLNIGLVVRTTTPAAAALPMLRQALWTIEPEIVFTEDAPAAQVAETTLAPTRIGAMAVGAFGVLALMLAAVGLYGVIAYSVSRRTREVGIRMALGAERGQVIRMIFFQGARLALVGVGLGTLMSAGIGHVLESLLYGVSGFDPIAYTAAAGLLLVVACAANLVPALTASRIDPTRALRSE